MKKDILWVHKMSLPFIAYGAAPDFDDIISLRQIVLVSGFEREKLMFTNID